MVQDQSLETSNPTTASSPEALINAAEDTSIPEGGIPAKIAEQANADQVKELPKNIDLKAFEKFTDFKFSSKQETPAKDGVNSSELKELESKEKKVESDRKAPSVGEEKTNKSKLETSDSTSSPAESEKPTKKQRDFTGLTKEEADLANNMSFKAYEVFKPMVIENKKLKVEAAEKDKTIKALQEGKEILPPNYYENPQSVIFSPTYRQAVNDYNVQGQVTQHWENQLLRIEKGEKWQDLVNDPKTGELMLGEILDPSPDAKVSVNKWLNQSIMRHQNFENKLKTIADNFTGEHQRLVSNIKAAEKQYFGFLDDEKNEAGKAALGQAKELLKGLGISEQNPIFEFTSRAGATIIQSMEHIKRQDKKIAELENQIKTGQQVKEDQRKAGPSSSSLASAGGNNGKPVPDYSKFRVFS